ncbi:MAG: polysaccharide deacetylase family protein [Bacillota bacterium]|nr:polysaccharide deacetylase family protein [Bacillota bacterium]
MQGKRSPSPLARFLRKLPGKRSLPSRKSKTGKPFRLALTFDDGPDPRYTPALLDLLAAAEVKATFFVMAPKAEALPELTARMKAEGHAIGLHGTDHRSLLRLGPAATEKIFRQGTKQLRKAGCPSPSWYRPPYGRVNPFVFPQLKRHGMRLLLWDVMVQDWRADATPELLLRKLRRRCRDGAVICLHDAGEGRAAEGAPLKMMEALRRFLPEMKARGCRFVLPEELNRQEG